MNQNQNNKNSSNQKLTFSLKTLVVIFLFLVAIYILVPRLVGIPEAIRLITRVNKFYLILALCAEILSYVGAATLLGVILSRLGYRIPFKDRFRLGSIGAFAIHFLPVGSFGEGAIEYYFLSKKKVETGSVLLMLILRIISSYSAFLFLFLIGLVLVPTAPSLHFSPKIVSLFLFSLIFFGILYMIYLYKNKEKFRKTWKGFMNFINFFVTKFSKQKPVGMEQGEVVFEDIYKGIGLFGEKKRTSVLAFSSSLLYWLGDMTCLFFVFLAFGHTIHWGILIFGYGVATLAGLISFIPGGLGVTEGSLALIYGGLGLSTSLALMSILVFRFFSFWIWIPIGLTSYWTLKRGINEDS